MLEIFMSTVTAFFLAFATFKALTDESMSRFILDSELPYV